MRVPISKIKVAPGRKTPNQKQVKALSESIAISGLINPITLNQDYMLVAGLHRLEAVRLLKWTDVECTVCTLNSLEAELIMIDENFVRSTMAAVDQGELLSRRKEVYEALHPETRAGIAQAMAMNRKKGNNVSETVSLTSKSFVQDTADRLGLSPRSIEQKIQIANHLTPEVKEIVRQKNIGHKNALQLCRLEPEQQKEAAGLLASGEIRTMKEYKPSDRTGPDTKPQPRGSAVFREIMADLQNGDKDFSCSPDIFLTEISSLTEKLQEDINSFTTPYYEAVFPLMSAQQMQHLQKQADVICSAIQNFVQYVGGAHHELPKEA